MDMREEIEKLAYELYEKSGMVHGRDLENWLEAESIVKARHARRDIASTARQVEQAAGAVAQKVRTKVKETATVLKTAAKKGVKKAGAKKIEP